MKLDAIIFSVKPGDAEIAMGATTAKLSSAKFSVGIIDLIDDGLNSEKTKEIKQFEISEADKILGVRFRENIGLGFDENPDVNELIKNIVTKLRKHKPELIFAPCPSEPDFVSNNLTKAVSSACALSANPSYSTRLDDNVQDVHEVKKIFYFFLQSEAEPTFIIDATETFDSKMDAVKAYVSNFEDMDKKNEVRKNAKDYFEYLEAKGRVYGYKINKKFGEPFYSEEKLEFDIVHFLQSNEGIGWK